MTMNTSLKSRGPIIVAEFLDVLEVVAGCGVEVVFVGDVIGSNEPLGIQTPLVKVSPGSHMTWAVPITTC